jgi:hypothetical protein
MTTIAFALVVFGLALIFFAITAPSGTHPAHRATGAGVGIVALIAGLLLHIGGRGEDRS